MKKPERSYEEFMKLPNWDKKEKRGPIIWLEDPTPYRYLREELIERRVRRGFTKRFRFKFDRDFYKIVGYQYWLRCDEESRVYYEYRVFYLRDYDWGCPNVCDAYSTEGKPCEGRNVVDLLKEKSISLYNGKV